MQKYAIDEFYDTESGAFFKGADTPLNIVFVGDSLTEGDSSYEIDGMTGLSRPWHFTDMVAAYFGKRTGRRVNMYNAGVGGTKTSFVAKMISYTVLSKNADIVFLENINDINGDAPSCAAWTENILENLCRAEKVPAVMLLHALNPFRGKALYDNQVERINAKNAVAEKYGITDSLDYFSYYYGNTRFDISSAWMLEDYGEEKLKNGDVHPLHAGYSRIGRFIIDRLGNGSQRYLRRLKVPDKTEYEESKYLFKTVFPSDGMFTYNGFSVYTEPHQNKGSGRYATQGGACIFPFGGYAQSVCLDGSSFAEFETDADILSICYKNPPERFTCNTAKVYVDGVLAACGGGSNPYANNYGSIDLSLSDGKKHKIRLVPDVPTEGMDVFNFLFLALGYKRF